MTKTLQKYGNSHALIIEKAIMDAMGITVETPLTIALQGSVLTVRPSNLGVGIERVQESVKKLRPKYKGMLKNLAK